MLKKEEAYDKQKYSKTYAQFLFTYREFSFF